MYTYQRQTLVLPSQITWDTAERDNMSVACVGMPLLFCLRWSAVFTEIAHKMKQERQGDSDTNCVCQDRAEL